MFTALIADDESTERTAVAFLLEQHFPGRFHIFQAENGKDALATVKEQRIDLLLSDIEMPFLNGIELAKESRKLQPDIELLFFSGYDNFEYVQSALLLRAVNYVLKPLEPGQFCAAIQEILSRLEQRPPEEQQIEERPAGDLTLLPEESGEPPAEGSDVSAPVLLRRIELAIQLKQPIQLSELAEELLGRYLDTGSYSHVYIRHVVADLLQILIDGNPDVPDSEFEKAAEEVYALRYFSDIRNVVQKYLDILVGELHREMDGPNFSINRVKQYISQHYGEDLTLATLADHVYLSPNYLSNMFTKVTGTSLNRYIRQFRMEKARELLVNTGMKISDVSQAVGYPSTSYFIKHFQQMYGMTPVAFRQQHTMQSEDQGSETP